MSALLLIALLVALIVVHEFGHFIVAKLLKVYVKEFGIGYPPRAFTFGKWKETEYTLNWLPFGGFVRLLEEDGSIEEAGRRIRGSFAGSPKWKQVLILLAGVGANLIFGWLLFTAAFMAGVQAEVEEYAPEARLVITQVVPGSPAERAGFQPGDMVTSVTDQRGDAAPQLAPREVVEFVQARGGKTLTIAYERGGETGEASLKPAHAILPDLPSQPALGMGLALVAEVKLTFSEALAEGLARTRLVLLGTISGVASLIQDAFMGEADIRTLIGPVGLAGQVGSAASYGVGQLLALAALISINLVVINLLPIPALDGGRLVFIALEVIRGRKLSRTAAQIMNALGFLFIVFLMIAITYNDIVRLIYQ